MKVLEVIVSSNDSRAKVASFPFSKDSKAEIVVAVSGKMEKGNHSHRYAEGIMLVGGSCAVRVWTEMHGRQERKFSAPAAFFFESGEEHAVVFEEGAIFLACLEIVPEKEREVPALHLDD